MTSINSNSNLRTNKLQKSAQAMNESSLLYQPLDPLRIMPLTAVRNHVKTRMKLSMAIEWLDHALDGGLQAGYPLTFVAMKEREIIDLMLHSLIQFWRQHPRGNVIIMDGNRHVRPKMVENVLQLMELSHLVEWEEQTMWFQPSNYLEALIMLEKIEEMFILPKKQIVDQVPVMLIIHQLTSLLVLKDGPAKVDAFFRQLSQVAFQMGLPVIVTNLIDFMDLLHDVSELPAVTDDEWLWYQKYQSTAQGHLLDRSLENGHDLPDTTSEIPDPWSLSFHQVAEREMLSRLPHHLYVLSDKTTRKRFGVLKEQHLTIGSGVIVLPHVDAANSLPRASQVLLEKRVNDEKKGA